MKQILIDDRLYADVCRRAADAGFSSSDEYVIHLLRQAVAEDSDDLDGFFTPERLSEIDKAVAEADAGKVIPLEQVREHFRRKFEQ